MKRQKIYLIVACLLSVLSIFVILQKQGVFNRSMSAKNLSMAFAIKDTTKITKIFMANMFGEKVLLTKTEQGWMVDNFKPADFDKIRSLFATLNSMRVDQPVSKSAQRTIIEMLAVSSVKTEIYETKPLFTLFGTPFFVKERLSRTYFFGDATQNSLGSFASLEGLPTPCIIYEPGFRGYVSPIFTPKPIEWYSPRVFETKLTRIQSASFIDLDNPNESFFVEKTGVRTFNLLDAKKNIIPNYDTLLLINMLSEFRERNYEQFLPNIEPERKDSIIKFNLYKIISVTDVENKTSTMKLYHMYNTGDRYLENELIEENVSELNLDRCYATFNDNTDEMFTIMFFHFDRQVQPLSYFLKK